MTEPASTTTNTAEPKPGEAGYIEKSGTATPPGGTPPSTAKPGGEAGTLDVTKLSDEDFAKVFEDPRLFNHPRFKSLNDKAKVADKLKADQEKAKEQALIEQGKFKELAENNDRKYKTAVTDNAIQREAIKLGVVDLDAVLKLVDRNSIKLEDDGTLSGVEAAVKTLLDEKAYLKGKPGQTAIGTPTAPGGATSDGKYKFTKTQLEDPVFYRANEAALLDAAKNNQIDPNK